MFDGSTIGSFKSKRLAIARRSLMEKVRQASGTGVRFFGKSMNSDLQVPSRIRGVTFLLSVVLFTAFVVILTYQVIQVESQALNKACMHTQISTWISATLSQVTDVALLKTFLVNVVTNSVFQSSPEGWSGDLRRVGSIRIRSLRGMDRCVVDGARVVPVSSDSLWQFAVTSGGVASLPSCFNDITDIADVNQSSMTLGSTGMELPFVVDDAYCVGSICGKPLPSFVSTDFRYPAAGNVIAVDEGNLLQQDGSLKARMACPAIANLQFVTVPNTTAESGPSTFVLMSLTWTTNLSKWSCRVPLVALEPNATRPIGHVVSKLVVQCNATTTVLNISLDALASSLGYSAALMQELLTPWSAVAENAALVGAWEPGLLQSSAIGLIATHHLVTDMLHVSTRFVAVEFSVFHPLLNMAGFVVAFFELPTLGGVTPKLAPRFVPLSSPTAPLSIFLWVYPAIQLLIQGYEWGRALLKTYRGDCAPCNHVDTTLIVFKCIKCKSPCELRIEKVSQCGNCGRPVPALRHSCWRGMAFDLWRTIVLVSMVSLLVSRAVSVGSMLQMTSVMMDPVTGVSSQQTSQFVNIASYVSVFYHGQSAVVVVFICSFVRLFHYVCRGQKGFQFARVMEFSMRPLLLFTINFLVVYSGFCFAFTTVNGGNSKNFATIADSYITSFRFLISQIGWQELGDVGPVMLCLFVLYFVSCLCLMFNIFPSVLSVSYKKALETPYYDVDVLSMWRFFKLSLLEPLHVVKRRQRRSSRGSFISVSSSATEGGGENMEMGKRSRSGSTFSSTTQATSIDDGHLQHSEQEQQQQLAALRAGARLEDLELEGHLKSSIETSDKLLLGLTDRETALMAALAQARRSLEELCRQLPKLIEARDEARSELAELKKSRDNGTAGDHQRRQLPTENASAVAARILSENADILESIAARAVVLPIIEDTSLLEPIACEPPVYADDSATDEEKEDEDGAKRPREREVDVTESAQRAEGEVSTLSRLLDRFRKPNISPAVSGRAITSPSSTDSKSSRMPTTPPEGSSPRLTAQALELMQPPVSRASSSRSLRTVGSALPPKRTLRSMQRHELATIGASSSSSDEGGIATTRGRHHHHQQRMVSFRRSALFSPPPAAAAVDAHDLVE